MPPGCSDNVMTSHVFYRAVMMRDGRHQHHPWTKPALRHRRTCHRLAEQCLTQARDCDRLLIMTFGICTTALYVLLHGMGYMRNWIEPKSSPGPKSRASGIGRPTCKSTMASKLIWMLMLQYLVLQASATRDVRVVTDAPTVMEGASGRTGLQSTSPKPGAQRLLHGSVTLSSMASSLTFSRATKHAFRRARNRASTMGGAYYKGRWMTAASLQLLKEQQGDHRGKPVPQAVSLCLPEATVQAALLGRTRRRQPSGQRMWEQHLQVPVRGRPAGS